MKLSAILDKFPDKTPIWSIGIVTIIISTAVSFVVIYTASKGEISTYLQSTNKVREVTVLAENNTLTSILELVHTNSTQITQLSASLYKALEQNIELSKRVSAIEKDLAVTGASLKACEDKLLKCRR